MKKHIIILNNKELEIYEDDDGKFIKPEWIKSLETSGTALKPAHEPMCLGRKPFKGSVADNVLTHGVGGINIDECRVGEELMAARPSGKTSRAYQSEELTTAGGQGIDHNGRFPANVMHDGSSVVESVFPNDNSRYFYCAKASKKDRDSGLDLFEEKTKVFNGQSSSSSEDIKDVEKRFTTVAKNIHPTVKPVELMQYLVRLVTPKGGKVLDPFMGSGSTGKATMFENREREANYTFYGIEMTEEYLPICKSRIEHAINIYEYEFKKEKIKEEKETGQMFLEI